MVVAVVVVVVIVVMIMVMVGVVFTRDGGCFCDVASGGHPHSAGDTRHCYLYDA